MQSSSATPIPAQGSVEPEVHVAASQPRGLLSFPLYLWFLHSIKTFSWKYRIVRCLESTFN